jgi:hypothetical protein
VLRRARVAVRVCAGLAEAQRSTPAATRARAQCGSGTARQCSAVQEKLEERGCVHAPQAYTVTVAGGGEGGCCGVPVRAARAQTSE